MPTNDYLVEMTFDPFASLLTPQEIAAFAERMALPTIEALRALAESGRILAGGTFLAASGFLFIARVSSPQELDEMMIALPLFPRARTRVVPLGTFESRGAALRARLEKSRAAAPQPPKG
jgi:Muconolactone delta-isomerase